MFYRKKENNYIWFKSDKDNFWFGPFESEITNVQQVQNIPIKNNEEIIKQLQNYKSYKNLI
jgi:hypothetical protein